MTDADALTERLARAMHAGEVAGGFAADEWDGMSADSRAWYRANAAAVLPIVAAEVRKAKAEALREAAPLMHDHHDAAWLETQATEYETGDSDEHR